MTFALRALSLSYLRRHPGKTLLTLVGVAAGVATFASIRAAERSLISSFQATVDRVAGRAQLQVSGAGGVAEEVQEAIRTVPGVEALAPVIEQVVDVEADSTLSILILGVDLVGDRSMREYTFEGEDADLDDPLLFLAQPDSVALSQRAADRLGIRKGDPLGVRIGSEPRRLMVRAVLRPGGIADAFGGAVAVTDVYAAQEIFGRGRRFDHIDVRLERGVPLADGEAGIRRAVGSGYVVETPERRGAAMERLISNFTGGLDISSAVALGIGIFLVFNAFSVAVSRRRRDIGILRAVGATPRQVRALFLAEACLFGALGGALGVTLGSALMARFLGAVAATAQQTWGVSADPAATMDVALVIQSVGLGVGASLLGAWVPASSAASVPPTAALASARLLVEARPGGRQQAIGGALLLLFAIVLGTWPPLGGSTRLVAVVLVAGGLGAALLTGPAAASLLRRAAPLLGRLSPVSGQLAADSLLSHLRRNAATATAVTLALAFVLGTAGYFESTREALRDWTGAALTSDLFIRTSASLAPSAVRFPSEMRHVILGVPGVGSVEALRQDHIFFRGDQVKLLGLESGTMRSRPRREFLIGDAAVMTRGLTEERKCAVSANFYRRFGVGIGDVVEVHSPGGTLRLPVAAVLNTFVSDRGAIIIDRSLFAEYWKDDRIDMFQVGLTAGADPAGVRRDLQARLAGRIPALISTREELAGDVDRAVDAFHALSRTAVTIALGVAFVGIVASLLISVVERSREIGILKALGGIGRQIRASVVYESLGLTLSGLVLALPLGSLLSLFLSTTVSEAYAGFHLPHRYPLGFLVRLTLALPIISIVAAWLPARQAVAANAAGALSHE